MHWNLIEHPTKYDGRQLTSLFAYRTCDLQGDSIVAFRGPCQVELTEMVDQEDVLAGEFIYSEDMLHFIVEHFDMDLEKAVTRQRLLIAIIKETLEQYSKQAVVRQGDDIYVNDKKLSVSIATVSRVSTMIHTGLNISSKNTPLPTISLPEIGVSDVSVFARQVLQAYSDEIDSIFQARCKVRGVD